jgi:hypothetical protein
VTTTTAFTLTCTNAALSSSTSVLVTVPGTTPVALPAAIQAAPASVPYQLDWQLTEPQSLNGEMTGTWITQDHRRAYVWDFATYYGHHVGVTGGAATVQDACFTMDNLHVSSGQYTRRGSVTGCYPWNRPFTNQFYLITTAEAVDFQSPAGLPGFIGRIPGGATALDGRSPSPLYFQVAPAASFAGTASATYFPTPPATGYSAATPFNSGTFGSWCTTEILGLRATLNNVPIDYPVYFCRTRAN